MVFDLERKYIMAIGLLLVALLAGGFVLLWQKSMAGFASAQISRVFGDGGWTEIKPRTNGVAVADNASAEEKKTAKAEKPVISWCAQKNSDIAKKRIVINEIAWMGSLQGYSDEWLELKNISQEEINLNGWQLQNKNQKIKVSFDEGEVIPAGGFYLLERTNDDSVPGIVADKIYSGSLGNSKESVYLFNNDCMVEDLVIAANNWPAGDNVSKKTMIRRANLLWQTSRNPGGTPKAENL